MDDKRASMDIILNMVKDKKITADEGYKLINTVASVNRQKKQEALPNTDMKEIEEKTTTYLKETISRCTKIPVHQIVTTDPFENIGIDSVMIKALNKALEADFSDLSKTVFFENQTLQELVNYFLLHHRNRLIHVLCLEEEENTIKSISTDIVVENKQKIENKKERINISPRKKKHIDDIAIVGISGRFPKASNKQEYWNNLINGIDCIEEIPDSRFDYNKYYHKEKGQKGKIYSKWGGFIEDVDKFDPLFFNISPKEASFIDPQERIFLQTAWEAVEDAGYTRESLKECKVGVFASAMYGHYELFGVEETMKGNTCATSSLFSSIPNRVSYLLNLHGPSVAIESACSSSLEAVRLASNSIKNGECDMAIVGGVNLSLHPNKYILLCQTNYLSTDGRCRTFGDGGDGYVPSEGCGVIVLRAVREARKNKDHIYAVIKGGETNHGGKTNGFSVPNPKAQEQLIKDTHLSTQIDPKTISYVEAHGTGTILGDPIEITGLTNAYSDFTQDTGFCSIGSVKSNIGHCEAAAGIAGVIKLSLMLQHKKLVPSIHSDVLNPNIDFEKTPFVVQQVYEDWKKPIINEDGRKVSVNRRGSISAFGAGGTNVHLILEEYEKAYKADYIFDKPRILVLSAKTKKALEDYANKIIEFVDENTINMDTKEVNKIFANITYTLHVGRETMPYRIAFVAQSIEDITYKLRDFLQGNNENIYTNHVRTDILEEVSYNDSLEDISRKWTEGYMVDWTKLYEDESLIKISLPTYPYQLERCWLSVDNSDNQLLEQKVTTSNTICQDNKQNIKDSQEWGDMEKYLRSLLGEEFGISPSRIDLEDTLDIYGIDSVMITNLTKKLEDRFGELSKTLFFEYQTLEELIKFFVNEYSYDEEKEVLSNTQNSQENRQDTSNSKHNISYCDIAIVGIAGTYPEAQNLDELWNNLLEGRDSISEIPIERWDYSKYKDYINKPDIKLSKWGGFIEDIDKFDPLFFNISPAEAELMDPQERVFLQTSWETIEDAGYTRNHLKDYNVGVYVGVTYGHYQLLGVEETLQGNPIALNSAFSAVANRVSYCLNLTGPSLAVDTMCSSSLTALHLACESIYLNECDMAIAGGINLAIHPSKYLLLGQTGFTSSDGRCRSFGAGGDGYVPGEGSGALLIKPLNKAIEDRDYIYGIIKGTVMNHGGKTNGFTVPNPNAQSRLIEEGLSKAGISPKTISYIEAHGTGTALGDPIEITALTKAYDEVKVPNACAIGSIKSNIGHLESASGIAGITKVLLQMKYSTLVPSIHANNLNPNINFTKTPFYVQRQLERWKPKEVEGKLIRRASISSFGAGGSNAHVIIEDYNRQEESYTQSENESYVITLSAKNKERLHDYVEKYIEFCNRILGKEEEDLPKLSHILADIIDVDEDNIQSEELLVEYGVDDVTFKVFIERVNTYLVKPITEHISLSKCTLQTIQQYIDNYKQSSLSASSYRVSIRDMAYTLQMCRESYCEKVAFVVSSIEELQNKCVDYIQGNEDIEGVYVGNDKNTQSSNNPLLKGNIYNELIMKAFDNKEFDSLAQLWVSGSIVPWHKLYEIIPGRRVSLPTYPFAKESYWIERVTTYEANDKKKVTKKVIKKANKKIVKEANKKQIVDNMSPEQFVISNIKNIVSDLIKLQEDKIDLDENFGNYGLDSLKLTALSNKINELLDINIEPTIAFSYSNIESLGKYILETYGEKLRQVLNRNTDNVNEIETIEDSEYDEINYIEEDTVTHNSSKIAIIGMDARMPGANNLDEFWKLLEEQRNSITEIPTHRFNWEEYYATTGKGKTNTKWGGFIQDEDKFDAGFFSISPFEAERMDPQQRLLLQTSWHAIEDAGYHITELGKKPVGVFTTIQRSEYPNMLVDNISDIDGQTVIGSMESMVANRISYIFNFTGPSEAINTACSSSLVVLNRGIKSIINKECDVALVGGACLALSPESFITQSSLGVLSSDGQCKTFDVKANGFVKGEGVGSILLKGYEQAVKDGDNIYAVIRGSSVNHGGKSNSLTAPNAVAQSKLIVQVLEESGVDPATISYIETHGTGTKLGDPVEINGLTNAFSKFISSHNKKHYCGLGSVKTNIGHLEPMAGLASVFKMVLALQHRKMPGIVNFTQLNPYIHLEETPFYIVEETMPWKRIIDDEGVSIPRRTGISSFGIGGTNAHIILEEYTEDEKQSNNEDIIEQEQMLFVLSAKNTEVLKEYAKNMLHFIEDSIKEQNNISLRNLTYTLQIGRMNLDERLAICISSTQELVVELQNYIEDNISNKIITKNNNVKQITTNQESDEIELLELNKLATYWVNGEKVNFKALYDEDMPRRISLPTYPFEKNSYWISNEKNQKISKQIAHPYITYNNSSLLKSCYVTNLEGGEYYLKHSLNKKEKQLPCMVMLEMVREACSLALEKPIKSLYNMTCQQNATIIDTPFELGIDIYPYNQHDVKFEINNHSLNEEVIFAQGYGSIDCKVCEEIDTHILRTIDLNASYEQRKVDKHVVLNPFIMERVMNILIDSMTSNKLILLSSNIPFYISELHVLDKLSIDGKLIINKEDIKHRSNYIEGHYDITYKNDEGKTQLVIKDIVIKLRHDWLIETNKTHKNQLNILEDLQHGKCNIQEAYSLID